jgi:hypothetical protein
MKTYVTPGHPTQEGAGYDCNCGECLYVRATYEVFQCRTRGHSHYVVARQSSVYKTALYADAETPEEAFAWLHQYLQMVRTR